MNTNTYVTDLIERIVTSFAGALLAYLGAGAVNLLDVDWGAAFGVAAGAAVVSLLKGLAARGIGNSTTASSASSLTLSTTGDHHTTD